MVEIERNLLCFLLKVFINLKQSNEFLVKKVGEMAAMQDRIRVPDVPPFLLPPSCHSLLQEVKTGSA